MTEKTAQPAGGEACKLPCCATKGIKEPVILFLQVTAGWLVFF